MTRWFGKDSSFSGRTDAWRFAAEAGRQRRLVGFGFNAFWSDPQHQLAYMESTGRDWIASSHSTFVDVYVDLGLVGLAIVVFVVLAGLGFVGAVALRGDTPATRGWLAIGVFALVENIAESMMLLHSVFWMLLIAACVASVRAGSTAAPSDDRGTRSRRSAVPSVVLAQ